MRRYTPSTGVSKLDDYCGKPSRELLPREALMSLNGAGIFSHNRVEGQQHDPFNENPEIWANSGQGLGHRHRAE